jgi:hypothetical protein
LKAIQLNHRADWTRQQAFDRKRKLTTGMLNRDRARLPNLGATFETLGEARRAEGRLLSGRKRRKYLNNFKTRFEKWQSAIRLAVQRRPIARGCFEEGARSRLK